MDPLTLVGSEVELPWIELGPACLIKLGSGEF